jgi:hypothetical protein
MSCQFWQIRLNVIEVIFYNDSNKFSFKEHVMQESILTPDQYRDLTKKILHSVESRFRIIHLNTLKHPKYRLKAPVHINLEHDENQVVASFDDIEAFAYAETESEAINQLSEEIVSIYEDLQKDEDNLGALPIKWWQYLKEIVECKSATTSRAGGMRQAPRRGRGHALLVVADL